MSLFRAYISGGILVGNVVTISNLYNDISYENSIYKGLESGAFWPAYLFQKIRGKKDSFFEYNETSDKS